MDNTIKKDKSKLIENLYKVLPIYVGDREVQSKIKNYYTEKNISSSVGMRLLNKRGSLNVLDNMGLLIFSTALFLSTGDKSINPKDYFDDTLIEMEKLYKKDIEENDRTVVFYNVDKIAENHYVSTKTSYQEIAYLANNSLIGYNFQTQRNATIILKGKDIIRIPTLNKKNLREIREKIKKGEFTANAISFNHEHTLKENPLIYNEQERTLTIELKEDEVLYSIDGYTRTTVFCGIIDESPKFPGNTMVNIFNYTEEQARNFIKQEASGSAITKEKKQELGQDDICMVMAKDINREGSNYSKLYDKITSNWAEVKLNGKYCTFETISNAIKWCFEINNNTDNIIVRESFDIIFKGLNEIATLKNKDFSDLAESRKKSIATYNGTFMLYIAIIQRLYKLRYHEELSIEDKNKFNKKIKEIISTIDFSIDNSLWKKLDIVNPKGSSMGKSMSIMSAESMKEYIETLIPDEVKKSYDNEETALDKIKRGDK